MDEQFNKLYAYLGAFQNQINERFDAFERKIDDLNDTLAILVDNTATKDDMQGMRSYLGMELLEEA